MNLRILGIIALLTTAVLIIVKIIFAPEFSIGEFVWQDILATLIVVFLAREAGAIEAIEHQPIKLVVNNKMEELTKIQEIAKPSENPLQTEATIKVIKALESLSAKIISIESNLHQIQVTSQPAPQIMQAETKANVPNIRINNAPTNVIKQAKPILNRVKNSMLQNIFSENQKLQKKAS